MAAVGAPDPLAARAAVREVLEGSSPGLRRDAGRERTGGQSAGHQRPTELGQP